MRALIIYFLSISLVSCAEVAPIPTPDNIVAPDFHLPDKAKRIVTLPIETNTAEFLEDTEIVIKQLYLDLSNNGYRYVLLDNENYHQIWSEEVSAVGGLFDRTTGAYRKQAYVHAISSMVRRIAIDTDCSLVLAPSFAPRSLFLSTRKLGGKRGGGGSSGMHRVMFTTIPLKHQLSRTLNGY